MAEELDTEDQHGQLGPTQSLAPSDAKNQEARIVELEKQVEEYLNGWKRAKADYLNLKRQTEEKREEWIEFVKISTIEPFLTPIEHIRLALTIEVADQKSCDHFKQGMVAVSKLFQDALKLLGVASFGKEGDLFDPMLHEAVDHTSDDSAAQGPQRVTRVYGEGYCLGTRVIRPALVTVSEGRNSSAPAQLHKPKEPKVEPSNHGS